MKLAKSTTFFLACALVSALPAAGQTLRSIDEIEALLENDAPCKVPFELTGKVLSTSPMPGTGEIILSDSAGGRMQFYRPLDLSQPQAGDTIAVEGNATISTNHEPYTLITEFRVLDHGKSPEPVFVRLSEMNARTHHLLTIRTEGVVIDAFPDEIDLRYMIVLLKDGNVVMPVTFSRDAFGDRKDLIDAKIRVTGIYRRTVGGFRKFEWPNIAPRTPDDIEVIEHPPKDPFSAPPIEKRLYMTSDEIAQMSKRSVTGEVLATWSGDRAMLRTEDGRIVNLRLAHGEALPPCGATIIAAGQPETDLFRINLAAARWKTAAETPRAGTDETAVGFAAAFWNDNGCRSINSQIHGALICARGIVRTLPSADDRNIRFVLECDDMSVTVDATSNRSAVDALQIGCEVKVTGRCILLTDAGRQYYSSAKIKGLALVIRSPADIVVLRRPSWWTPVRLTAVISALLAALIGVYIWNRVLQNLVNRRGRELYREQVAHAIAEFKTDERTRLAVELHDSLSQALSGVACHMAVGADTFDTDPATARHYLATARKMLNSCRTELRQCLFDLRSDTLEEQDFSAAIRKTLNQLDGDAAIAIRFNVPRRRLKDTTAHAILAIIRELTGNAIRHGSATEVKIAGCIEHGRILFSVKDNGGGFDPANCDGPDQGHFGLEGIRNRLEKLNGTFTIDSSTGAGVKATVTIPLPAARTQEARKS
ncbi:MAG: sensor histidine kinase [Kiritimatiellae bacterium]|nr:sensor histidine kinase [Kiritimatiellia bacterium]